MPSPDAGDPSGLGAQISGLAGSYDPDHGPAGEDRGAHEHARERERQREDGAPDDAERRERAGPAALVGGQREGGGVRDRVVPEDAERAEADGAAQVGDRDE